VNVSACRMQIPAGVLLFIASDREAPAFHASLLRAIKKDIEIHQIN